MSKASTPVAGGGGGGGGVGGTTAPNAPTEKEVNVYTDIRHDREVYKIQTLLLTWMTSMKRISFLPSGK